MFPRKPLFPRQVFAHASARGETGFAPTHGFRQDIQIGGSDPKGHAPHCYPFPSDWPGPLWAGLSFGGNPRAARLFANPASNGDFHLVSAANPVESGAITTNARGRTSCGNLSLSFFLSPCRWPAACKTPRLAGLPARRLARLSPMPPKAMRLTARSSAVLPVWQPAASTWACRPAIDLPACGLPACGLTTARASTNHLEAASRAFPAGPLSFLPRPGALKGESHV
jgi:hypothetical protein